MTGLLLENPQLSDMAEFIEATQRSVNLHHPWVSPPLTKTEFQQYLQRCSEPDQIAYIIKKSNHIVGVINLNNTIRGAFQNAFLGFYAMIDYARQGYMFTAVKSVIALAFSEHKLHRLEANIQPDNIHSINLVKRLGFRKEGVSLRYLYINNEWKDHERWAITAEEVNVNDNSVI